MFSLWCLFFFFLLSASIGISVHTHSFVQPEITSPVPFFLVVLFFIAWLVILMRRFPFPRFRISIIILLLMFVFLSIASSLADPAMAVASVKWLVVQGMILISLMLLASLYHKKGLPLLDHLLAFVVLYGTISLLFALYLFIQGNVNVGFATITQFPGYLRLYGWYGNPNLLTSVMGIAFISSFMMSYRSQHKSITNLILCLVMFSGVILGASMTVIVSLVLAFIAYFVLCKLPKIVGLHLKTISRKKIIVFILALFSMIAFVYIFTVNYFFFTEILKIEQRDITGTGRTYIWREGLELYAQGGIFSILFGNGFDSFHNELGRSAHSFYVRHLFETGILYILFFLIINTFILVMAIKDSYSSKTLLSSSAIFVFLIIFFMLVRNLGTPSFFQVRVENIIYFASIVVYFSARKDNIKISN